MKRARTTIDPEIAAISAVYAALQGLELDAQARVLNYVANKLRLPEPSASAKGQELVPRESMADIDRRAPPRGDEELDETDPDGISPSGAKWMKRNGLQASSLERLFSLGGDEIDLIAESVPGKNKKERMHSVLLLRGIAAYLATGAARFTHEQMKDACVHYDAFDAANFAAYFRSMSGEVTGGKSEGYTLTPRGIAGATEIVKSLVNAKQATLK